MLSGGSTDTSRDTTRSAHTHLWEVKHQTRFTEQNKQITCSWHHRKTSQHTFFRTKPVTQTGASISLGRVKRYRKKRTGTPVPYAATMPNDVWTMDIINDSCMNGTKRRILSVVDEFTRECMALEVSTHINSYTVRSVLSRLFTKRAVPRFLRSDNGGEFIARSTAMLLHDAKCTARFIQPGKPWQNGFIESFHSTLRRDHLDVEVFFNLLDAQLKTGIYRNYYNRVRPHSALGYKAPVKYATTRLGPLCSHW
jgi:putative transposase